nr:MAG TPA: hypothetical protein [Caudoviricetes sp.]
MTDTTLKLTEAFNRHNSLYNALLGNLKTLTTAHTEEVSITLDAGKVRALTRILNAAPLDGDPLYTRVNVETDTDAWETDASKINRYLEENDLEPNLKNVAAAFLYAETEFSQLDIELQGKEYRVTRIQSVQQYTSDGGGRSQGFTKITVTSDGWKGETVFDFYGTELYDVEGEECKKANARALSYYHPDNVAALGGILMERITG